MSHSPRGLTAVAIIWNKKTGVNSTAWKKPSYINIIEAGINTESLRFLAKSSLSTSKYVWHLHPLQSLGKFLPTTSVQTNHVPIHLITYETLKKMGFNTSGSTISSSPIPVLFLSSQERQIHLRPSQHQVTCPEAMGFDLKSDDSFRWAFKSDSISSWWKKVLHPGCLLGLSPFKGLPGGIKQLGYHPKGTTTSPMIYPLVNEPNNGISPFLIANTSFQTFPSWWLNQHNQKNMLVNLDHFPK